MRVILRKEVENLGDVGDVVEVSDGYGMNHLIPKGIALHATANSVRAAQHEQLLRQAQIDSARKASQAEAGKFSGVEVEFTVRAGGDGRLFGSVTNRDIEAALAEKGLEVSRRKIQLEEPIKRIGEYDVAIRLHPEVRAEVEVHVLPALTAPPEEEAKEDGEGSEVAAPEAAAGDETEESAPEAEEGASDEEPEEEKPESAE